MQTASIGTRSARYSSSARSSSPRQQRHVQAGVLRGSGFVLPLAKIGHLADAPFPRHVPCSKSHDVWVQRALPTWKEVALMRRTIKAAAVLMVALTATAALRVSVGPPVESARSGASGLQGRHFVPFHNPSSNILVRRIPHPARVAAASSGSTAPRRPVRTTSYLASVTSTSKAAPSGIGARSWLKIAHFPRAASYQTPTWWSL